MKTTTITQAKNGLSALIDQVKAGESILILDRGMPVARLEPVRELVDADGRSRRLERAGLLRLPVAAPPVDLLLTPGPALKPGFSAVDVLIEERRSGR
jgi:prevent-host-death family protein